MNLKKCGKGQCVVSLSFLHRKNTFAANAVGRMLQKTLRADCIFMFQEYDKMIFPEKSVVFAA